MNKQINSELLANSFAGAFNNTLKTMQQYNINNSLLTLSEYIERQKEELKGLLTENSIITESTQEYYSNIENWIKEGYTIPQKIFDSLPDNLQKHFNKHYNYRGDKITA